MSTYLITGASRGIGLELAKILTSLPSTEVSLVFATTRQSQPTTLHELAKSTLGRVVPVQMDPSDPASVEAAVEQVERVVKEKLGVGKGLDVLINNSGVMDYTGGPAEKMENLTETFNTNVTLAHIATQAFMPLLRQGQRKTVANVTSTLGSLALAPQYKSPYGHGYKISKAGLNMLTRLYAMDYEHEGFTFFAVSPGWLKTDLGGDYADLPVEVGAKDVVRILREADKGCNGRFINVRVEGWEEVEGPNRYDGKDSPW